MRLAVPAFARYPTFKVVHADFSIAHVAGADIHHTVGQLQRLHKFLRVLQQLLVPAHRLLVIGLADHVLFYLIELVNAEDATRVLAICACFFTETRAEANKSHGQVFFLENLVLVHAGDRDFGGTHEECIFILDGINLVSPLRELAVADEAEFAHHCRHDQRGEPLARNAVKSEVHQRQFQPCRVAFEHVAARARNLDGSLDIHQVELLHQAVVIKRLKIKCWRLAPILNRYIIALVIAYWCTGIRNVGDKVKQLLPFVQQLVQPRLHSLDLFCELFAFRDEPVTQFLIFPGLFDTLRELVLPRSHVLYLALERDDLPVDLQQVIDIDGAAFDPRCLLDGIWMAANKSEIKHNIVYSFLKKPIFMRLMIVSELEKTPPSAKRTATLNMCSRGATLIRLSRRKAKKDLNVVL